MANMTTETEALINQPLPQMSLMSSTGDAVEIPGDFEGQWTVLYFYPKDDTPGCTKQACSYRDHVEAFDELDAEVVGVSMDPLASHKDFIKKYNLNFMLLADVDHRLSEKLGVYGDQEWQGKVFKGLSRDTFLIDPEGVIRMVWRKVDPTTTMAETHAKLQALLAP